VRIIGNALTLTYDYQKAITYYENALQKNPARVDLLVDLGGYFILLIKDYIFESIIQQRQKAY